jgi:biopolymer transport protein ExbB/TolQ
MNIGALLKSFIYLVSGMLLFPTLFLLSVLIVWILIFAGGIFGEWLERVKLKKASSQELAQLILSNRIERVCPHTVCSYLRILLPLTENRDSFADPIIESLLQERVSQLWKSSDHLRMLVRIGPGLGLIGTLIPMSTGLAALSQGDISKLSSDLVVAFTTTVVGLAIGLSAYFLYGKKRRWIEDDVRQIEFVTEIIAESAKSREVMP